jgi:hypothetical protein
MKPHQLLDLRSTQQRNGAAVLQLLSDVVHQTLVPRHDHLRRPTAGPNAEQPELGRQ